jgi:hypothetical protein
MADCVSPVLSVAALRVARTVLRLRVVPDRGMKRDGDGIDILVYLLWAGVLLVLLRYV